VPLSGLPEDLNCGSHTKDSMDPFRHIRNSEPRVDPQVVKFESFLSALLDRVRTAGGDRSHDESSELDRIVDCVRWKLGLGPSEEDQSGHLQGLDETMKSKMDNLYVKMHKVR
jgi:hypothetical protein